MVPQTLLRVPPPRRYLVHKAKLVSTQLLKGEVPKEDREYWARRKVGSNTWEDLDDEAR